MKSAESSDCSVLLYQHVGVVAACSDATSVCTRARVCEKDGDALDRRLAGRFAGIVVKHQLGGGAPAGEILYSLSATH